MLRADIAIPLLASLSSCLAACSLQADPGHGHPWEPDPAWGPTRADVQIAPDAPLRTDSQKVWTPSRGTDCAGRLAASALTRALCVCDDVGLAGRLEADTLEQTDAGAVGVNGSLSMAGELRAGTLDVGQSVGLAGNAQLRGDVRIGGTLGIEGLFQVGRDLWLVGDVDARQPGTSIVVGRDLHQPAGRARPRTSVSASIVEAPFTLVPPCPCDEASIVDVAAIVRQAAADNDMAALGIAPDALDSIVGRARLELPGGRIYFDAIRGAADVELVARGKTALFIGGDLTLAGSFVVTLAPDAELDVYVGGRVSIAGEIALAPMSRPSASRLWVAGGGEIDLAGSGRFVGNLYAPRAALAAAADLQIVGSAFVGSVSLAGGLVVRYDGAILHAGDSCDLPAPVACTTVRDCANGLACQNGRCAACTGDSDCGSPLACNAGTCAAAVF